MSALEESPNTKFRQFYTASRCSNLPLELINSIFRQCNRDDLKQCALTCRSWNAAVRPIFFSSVDLRSTTKSDNLISLVMKDNAIGAFVKDLCVLELELNLHSLYLFSKIFKNIESFTFDGNNASMYKWLYDLLSLGEFPSLKSILEPVDSSKMEMYLQCISIIKNRMTQIDIFSLKAYESFQRFHTFVKLNTIKIQFNNSIPISAIDLFEGITQKSNLPTVKEIEVEMRGNSFFASNRLIPRMDDIQPMPNVSDLEIMGYNPHSIIDDTFMRYIIKKFPNLQRLELRSYAEDYSDFFFHLPKEDNQIVLSVDVTVKFLKYISGLSTFNVQHIVTEGKTAEIIKKFCSNQRKKKSLDDPPSLYIFYNEEMHGNQIDLAYPVVSMKSAQPLQNLAPSITVGLNPFYDPVFNNGQEEQKIIKHTGQYFTKITLDNVPTFSLWVLLTNTAKYCVNLKELVILDSSDLLEETAEWCDDLVVNHSLTHLTVEPNVECPDLLSLVSYMFAGLEMLSFSTDRMHIKHPEEKRLAVTMPKLSVRNFQLELELYYEEYYLNTCSDFRVLVQLDVGEKSRYLLFNKLLTGLTLGECCPIKFDREISAFEFEESKEVDENYFIYHVQCKSAETVSIKYAVGSRLVRGDLVYRIHQVHF